ncbi:MAG TPA: hypothetical protein PLB52_01445 [Candidatus Moranbacteria bacterium]|nr:hypothetical protein [Candidatus Moranbacteria bacterium]
MLQILIFGGLVLVGFLCGYFFQTTVLIVLSAIFIGIGIIWMKKAQEIEGAFALFYFVCVIIVDVAKWVTWYFINDKKFIQEFFKQYVLR